MLPKVSFLSFFKLKGVFVSPKNIAPIPTSPKAISSSLFSFFFQTLSLSNIASFSSIQPFLSSSNSLRSEKPSPLFVPNNSLPSSI